MRTRPESNSNSCCRFAASSDSAATIVDFSIIATLLIFLIIGVIDLSRLLAMKGMISYGVHAAVSDAIKEEENLVLDYRDCDQLGNPPSCDPAEQTEKQAKFEAAMERVLAEAKRLPIQTFSDLGADAGTRLLDINVIRPGSPDYPADQPCFDVASEVPFDGFAALMQRCPFIVEIEANVKMLLPVFDQLEIKSTAFGFSDYLQKGYPISVPYPTPPPSGGTSGEPPGEPCGTGPICEAGSPDMLCCPEYADLGCTFDTYSCQCNCDNGDLE